MNNPHLTGLGPARVAVVGATRNSLSLARALSAEGCAVDLLPAPGIDPALLVGTEHFRAIGVEAISAADLSEVGLVYFTGYVDPVIRARVAAEARGLGADVSTLGDYVMSRATMPTIGVTGTAGKSSVSNLIAHLLQAASIPAHIAVDSGPQDQFGVNHEVVDALTSTPSGAVVAEMAAQGLVSMCTSPNIAVVTSLFPDHIEDFGSLEAYVDAKRTIVRHQSKADWAILPDDAEVLAAFAPACPGQVMTFGETDPGSESAAFIRAGRITVRLRSHEFDLGAAPSGAVDVRHALPACVTALLVGADPATIATALPTFQGLRFRRSVIADVSGVLVINDALAATPAKAEAGLTSVSRPIVWIAGGRAKFRASQFDAADPALADFESLAAAAKEHVKRAFIFGETGAVLLENLAAVGVTATEVSNLEEAVDRAIAMAASGDAIVFSPALYVEPADRTKFDQLILHTLAEGGRSRS